MVSPSIGTILGVLLVMDPMRGESPRTVSDASPRLITHRTITSSGGATGGSSEAAET